MKEKIELIEKEISTLTDKIETVDEIKNTVADIQTDIKGLKIFLQRVYPEFKNQFPEIIKKLRG